MPRKKQPASDLDEIKRRAVIALYSDDDFVDRLVLKGGNALNLVYGLTTRASADLDFSMSTEFARGQLDDVRTRIEYRLTQAFRDLGYQVFDVRLTERPPLLTEELADFWGGYHVQFKIIEVKRFAELRDLTEIRRNATVVAPGQRRNFEIEISKHEYCEGKRREELQGYTIYVYTPAMIACEKLRAICQQMPSYAAFTKRHPAPRARDFLDIFDLISRFKLDLTEEGCLRLLSAMFAVKQVPLNLLGQIPAHREFHRDDWRAVLDTVRPGVVLRDFDFYAQFVESLAADLLQVLWDV